MQAVLDAPVPAYGCRGASYDGRTFLGSFIQTGRGFLVRRKRSLVQPAATRREAQDAIWTAYAARAGS
jgi:hypothetical protein